jgi:hypothetical protein
MARPDPPRQPQRKLFSRSCADTQYCTLSYPDLKGRPYLRVVEDFILPFEIVDLTGLPEQERAGLIEEKVLAAGRYPFRLTEDLPIRITVLRTGERAATLVLVIHHIACDAWSMGLLVGELARLYPVFLRQEPSPLPELVDSIQRFRPVAAQSTAG